MISLRTYQQECVESILSSRQRGVYRPLISLATGLGKTMIFSEIAKKINRRTIIIAHRDELIRQAKEKLLLIWPEIEKILASSRAICMSQTSTSLLHLFSRHPARIAYWICKKSVLICALLMKRIIRQHPPTNDLSRNWLHGRGSEQVACRGNSYTQKRRWRRAFLYISGDNF